MMGVIHEINTPLTVMKANLQMLQMDLEHEQGHPDHSKASQDDKPRLHDKPWQHDICAIENGIERLNNVTRVLAALIETSHFGLEKTNLYVIISTAIQQLSIRKKSDISINYQGISLAQSQLSQNVSLQHKEIINLLSEYQIAANVNMLVLSFYILFENAIGLINEMQQKTGSELTIHTSSAGQHHNIQIICSNCTISEELLDQPFSPSYETQSYDLYAGKGMGLFSSKKIISEHGGEVFLYRADANVIYEVKLPKYDG